MVNEDIVGGLISALSRGESLERAMMTFYNAGYEREEIEESAKVVYSQLGAQAMGIKTSLQESLDEIASKAGIAASKPKQVDSNIPHSRDVSPNELRLSLQSKSPELNSSSANQNIQNGKVPQNISNYEIKKSGEYNSNSEQLAAKIEQAIKDMKNVNIPSKIEIISKNIESKPQVIQKVSDYREDAPNKFNKTITYILISILLFLLVILGAVFFFKDDLIRIFNNAGLS